MKGEAVRVVAGAMEVAAVVVAEVRAEVAEVRRR